MTNQEKDDLHCLVKREIALGHSEKVAVLSIARLGFKKATIRRYYQSFAIYTPNHKGMR